MKTQIKELLKKWTTKLEKLEKRYDEINNSTTDFLAEYEEQCAIDEDMDIIIEVVNDIKRLAKV